MAKEKLKLPFFVFVFVLTILTIVHLNVSNPILILERFIQGGGWVQILLIAFYASFISFRMQDPDKTPIWRLRIWTLFAVVFFSQLILGILVDNRFLMTGNLHLPIPMMIIGGPLYRAELSFMTILFLSTIILSGPSWCSQLCYFGAIDNLFARGNTRRRKIRNRTSIKWTLLMLVILASLSLRWAGVSMLVTTLLAISFGGLGLIVILWFSRKHSKMIHCVVYCPVGTVVNYLKFVNPFRMYIDSSCTLCMKCTKFCKYDALTGDDIRNLKPGITCTYCGDCIPSCHVQSIKYKFLKMDPDIARKVYLFITISIHAIFLALAKI